MEDRALVSRLDDFDDRLRKLEQTQSRYIGGAAVLAFVFSFVVGVFAVIGNSYISSLEEHSIKPNTVALGELRVAHAAEIAKLRADYEARVGQIDARVHAVREDTVKHGMASEALEKLLVRLEAKMDGLVSQFSAFSFRNRSSQNGIGD